MARFNDITGIKTGLLTALRATDERTKSGAVIWIFKCDCGGTKKTDYQPVKAGRIKSCGCLYYKHGMTKNRLYNIWVNMRQRCANPKSTKYKNWGGKGVKVCEEWDNSFVSFSNWALKSGYSSNLTIDRIDNDGDYTPENCQWATYKHQARNRKGTRKITANGETMLLCEWAEATGLSRSKIALRIDRYGYTPEQALELEVGRCVSATSAVVLTG